MPSVGEDAPALPVKEPRTTRARHPLARLWRRIRKPLADSRLVKHAIAGSMTGLIRVTARTNRLVEGSTAIEDVFTANPGAIYALWHGQHLLAPALYPRGYKVVAMFSRSADAELNAMVGERFGIEIVRGSGGRDREKATQKGGARALLALKKALDGGKAVCMIADIPHGQPRQAGLGIITLARISNRPIIGIAVATSRRKVFERSWDRTTLNLPFGRRGVVATGPIHVPADASPVEIEERRVALTAALNAATARAYSLVDGTR